MKAWRAGWGCWLLAQGLAWAQPETLQSLREAQAGLEQQLQALQQHQQAQARACWQRFAVNDCLLQVRRQARTTREPLQAQLQALRLRERELLGLQREQRLQEKAAGDD